MQDGIELKGVSPIFSVRVDITDTEKKVTFTGEGDKETAALFFATLRRLYKRMESSEFVTEPLYNVESTKEKEITISLTKEQLEEFLHTILSI